MKMTGYIKGHLYFWVNYLDVTKRYPQVEVLVYAGENLSDEDVEPTWYFQFADSVASGGLVTETAGGDRRCCLVKQSATDRPLTVDQLCVKLREAAARNATKT